MNYTPATGKLYFFAKLRAPIVAAVSVLLFLFTSAARAGSGQSIAVLSGGTYFGTHSLGSGIGTSDLQTNIPSSFSGATTHPRHEVRSRSPSTATSMISTE
jgi:hypothetical protein